MDGDKFYLYKHTGKIVENKKNYNIRMFKSSIKEPLFSLMCKSPKTAEYNDLYTELRWFVASKLRLRIYYILSKNTIVHSSFCTPKSFKFPFMNSNDYHIGPCFTDSRFRGRGVYSVVLGRIVSDLRSKAGCGDIYMIIEEHNTSSREGVKKAGFTEVATLYRKGRLKRYYVKEWL